MEAIRRKVRVRPDGTVEWPEVPKLPAGEAELLLLYAAGEEEAAGEPAPTEGAHTEALAAHWPVLMGGAWKGGTLRREALYGDEGR